MRLHLTPRECARFWSKADRSGDCWLWTGALDGNGYGHFHVQSLPGRPARAVHRIAYALSYGEVPADHDVRHTCDAPSCVRPDHLIAVYCNRETVSARLVAAQQCRHCGQTFYVEPWRIERSQARYCSKDCQNAGQQRPRHSLAERFWSKVERGAPDECWPWRGYRHANGYGHLFIGRNYSTGAHRVSWALHNGPIAEDAVICHRCDNRHCVNPAHLFVGTARDNVLDKMHKGRGLRGSRHPNAKLGDEHVLNIRRAYAAGGVTMLALAQAHGVSTACIWTIVAQRTWRHLLDRRSPASPVRETQR